MQPSVAKRPHPDTKREPSLAEVPQDVANVILAHLPTADLNRLAGASKSLHSLVAEHDLRPSAKDSELDPERLPPNVWPRFFPRRPVVMEFESTESLALALLRCEPRNAEAWSAPHKDSVLRVASAPPRGAKLNPVLAGMILKADGLLDKGAMLQVNASASPKPLHDEVEIPFFAYRPSDLDRALRPASLEIAFEAPRPTSGVRSFVCLVNLDDFRSVFSCGSPDKELHVRVALCGRSTPLRCTLYGGHGGFCFNGEVLSVGEIRDETVNTTFPPGRNTFPMISVNGGFWAPWARDIRVYRAKFSCGLTAKLYRSAWHSLVTLELWRISLGDQIPEFLDLLTQARALERLSLSVRLFRYLGGGAKSEGTLAILQALCERAPDGLLALFPRLGWLGLGDVDLDVSQKDAVAVLEQLLLDRPQAPSPPGLPVLVLTVQRVPADEQVVARLGALARRVVFVRERCSSLSCRRTRFSFPSRTSVVRGTAAVVCVCHQCFVAA